MAHWALAQGWAEGTVVALYMENRPLVVALWLGLATVGVEAALVNYNLRRRSLLHCIGESGAQAVVFGLEMTEGKKVMGLLWAVIYLLFKLFVVVPGTKCNILVPTWLSQAQHSAGH